MNKGKTSSSPHLVRRRRHRRGLYRGIGRERRLDFEYADILAAAAHDALLAVEKIEETRRIGGHDVAGMEPSVRPGLLRRRRVFQIAREEAAARIGAGSAHQKFAGRPRRDV